MSRVTRTAIFLIEYGEHERLQQVRGGEARGRVGSDEELPDRGLEPGAEV